MADSSAGEITRLLKAFHGGNEAAFDELVRLVHDELRVMAHRQLRKLRPGQTLDTTALVNEAYLRLVEGAGQEWQNRSHFFGVTARAMRFIVVDHARERASQKRGDGVAFATLDPDVAGVPQDVESVLAVNRAVDLLQQFNDRLARVVECRFFGGMTESETAEALGVSERSVQRDWKQARAWLHRVLSTDSSVGDGTGPGTGHTPPRT